MGRYKPAQVCLNGHSITSDAEGSPELTARFCKRCGAATITACPSCKAIIRGYFEVEGVISLGGKYEPPRFCHECGKPYPWTEARIAALKEMADDMDELSGDDREKLKGAIDDIVTDNPRTELGANRFKRILSRVGMESAKAIRDLVVDVASETAKKIIMGG